MKQFEFREKDEHETHLHVFLMQVQYTRDCVGIDLRKRMENETNLFTKKTFQIDFRRATAIFCLSLFRIVVYVHPVI